MENHLITEGKYTYKEIGEGRPIIILHGLMGQLSNFDGVVDFFPKKGYKIVLPELPLYSLPIVKTKVSAFAKFVKEFIEFKNYTEPILLGNSLGGHIALSTLKLYPEHIHALIITGS